MSQLDDSIKIEYVPNELIVRSKRLTQRIWTEKNKPQNLSGCKSYGGKRFDS